MIPMQDRGESLSMKIGPRMLYLPAPGRKLEPEAGQERIGFIDPESTSTSYQKQAWGQKCLEFSIPLIKIICFML